MNDSPVFLTGDEIECSPVSAAVVSYMSPAALAALDVPGTVIAGGYARFLYALQHPTAIREIPAQDIDIFRFTPVDQEPAAAAYYTDVLRHVGYYGETVKEYSTTYRAAEEPGRSLALKAQVILADGHTSDAPAWLTPEDVLSSFGFRAEMFGIVKDGDGYVFLTTARAQEDAQAAKITINRTNNPIRTARRIVKYGQKGFDIAPSQVALLFDAFVKASEADRALWNTDLESDEYNFQNGK